MAKPANLFNIPHFLSAETPEGLRQLMLANNVSRLREFRYQIVHDGTNWVAWFYDEASETKVFTKKVKNVSASQ
jgi:hypothetical protein